MDQWASMQRSRGARQRAGWVELLLDDLCLLLAAAYHVTLERLLHAPRAFRKTFNTLVLSEHDNYGLQPTA